MTVTATDAGRAAGAPLENGRVVAIAGPVVDVEFPPHGLPEYNRAIPHGDPFSFTMLGAHWVAQEWLADIGLYLLYQAGGLTALSLATALVVTATFLSVYFRSPLRPHAAVFTTLLAALAAAAVWGPRPATLTILFSALTLTILRRARVNPRWLWSLPALFVLWANVHSGFFLGLVIVGATLAGELVEQWLARRRQATADGGAGLVPLVSTATSKPRWRAMAARWRCGRTTSRRGLSAAWC